MAAVEGCTPGIVPSGMKNDKPGIAVRSPLN